MKEIKLIGKYKNLVALVDDDWYEYLNQWKWYGVKDENKIYVARYVSRKSTELASGDVIRMHRLIIKSKAGMQIDHKDGNGLNNTKDNLRICTPCQNAYNTNKHSNNTSGYKGVYLHVSGGYVAQIRANGKRMYLGYFRNSIDAAKSYDNAATKYHGEFAKTNF